MEELNVLHEYAQQIKKHVKPITYPLALKMIERKDDVPEGAKRPTVDFGVCMSLCQAFSLSRRSGESIAEFKEDMRCPEPVIGLGLAEPPQYFFDGYTRYPMGVETPEAGANWAREFPRFEVGNYVGIVSAPLENTNFEPDVILIYCNSAQLLRLLLGLAYKDGRDITTVLGGHSACVYAVVPTMLKGECQVAVPCRGDRGFAGAQDDEMIFSAPTNKLGDIVLGLNQEFTGQIPTRYTMQYQHMLSKSYAQIARLMGMKNADGTELRGRGE